MAQDKIPPGSGVGAASSRDTAKLSDDITRVVNFLDDRRSNASERSAELAHDLANRREEIAQPASAAGVAVPPPQAAQTAPTVHNPELSVRYHSFCSEMDQLLDTFRARVNSSKPVAH